MSTEFRSAATLEHTCRSAITKVILKCGAD